MAEDISHYFDGRRHFHLKHRKASINPPLSGNLQISAERHVHRDILHRITLAPKDVLRYVSPSHGKPKRMLVQATKTARATTTARD